MNYQTIEVRWVSCSTAIHESQFNRNAYVDLKHKSQTPLFNNIKNVLFVCLNPSIDKKYWLCLGCKNAEHTTKRHNRTRIKTMLDCNENVKFHDKPDKDMVLKELI